MLQLEGTEGNALGGDVQRAAEGEIDGAGGQSLLGGEARDIGVIILLGEMCEDEMARSRVEDFGIGEEVADDGIGKMAGAAHHALFDVPGIRANLEHFEIVIGFEHQKVGIAKMLLYMLGQVTEIGGDGDFGAIRAKSEANGIGGIMGDAEGIDFHVANFKAFAGADELDALEGRFRARIGGIVRVHFQNFAMGGLGEIRRTMPMARELREGVGVIAVLVGDEDRIDAIGKSAVQRGKAPRQLFFAEASVDEKSGAAGFEQRAVAGAARSQYGDTNRDARLEERPDGFCFGHDDVKESWRRQRKNAVVVENRTRRNGALINPGEKVQALGMYTAENGWFFHAKNELGSIEIGKLTVVGGRVVHDGLQ